MLLNPFRLIILNEFLSVMKTSHRLAPNLVNVFNKASPQMPTRNCELIIRRATVVITSS